MPGFLLEHCDDSELDRTRKDMERSRRYGMEVSDDPRELLSRLDLTNGAQLTNACVVLFAQSPLQWSPHLNLRLILYSGGTDSKPTHHMDLSGPAIRCLSEAMFVIQRQHPDRMVFDPQSTLRTDVPAYPPFAIREALVNALVHRDYERSTGNTTIELHPKHLVITNPAQLSENWTETSALNDRTSHLVNPTIANVFLFRGYMEQMGSGIPAIIRACKELNTKAPSWRMHEGMLRLTIHQSSDWSIQQLGVKEKLILDHMRIGWKVPVSDLAEVAGVTERQARRYLANLIKHGLVRRDGKGPSSIYIRIQER
jgi:ATP-dependent DNA helicase RecG